MSHVNNVSDPFYSGWDQKYREQAGDAEAWSDTPQPFVLEAVKSLAPNSKVADLGCGDGRNTRVLTEAGHRVVAVDLSPAALNQMMAKLSALNLPAPAHQAAPQSV